MNLAELTETINNLVEVLEFSRARVYIEENLPLLNENKNMLNRNARELLNFLTARQKEGNKPLTRKDMATISAINSYATKFDLRGLKVLVRDNSQLLLENETLAYLNSDAKIILEGMGAIIKKI